MTRQGSEFLQLSGDLLVKGRTLWPHCEATRWVAREAETAEVQLTW